LIRGARSKVQGVALVPKLELGNSVLEALASCLAKPELHPLGSQAGAWELASFTLASFKENFSC